MGLIVLLSIVALLPLFKSGFIPIHDNTQIARVSQMAQSLTHGMFPVRWVNDLGYGYGYPIFNFYAPLAYYFGGFLQLFGLSPLISTKLMMGFGFALAGVSMFSLARSIWGERGGLVAAALYVLAPYHALNLYVRGAVAETWAYGLVPFIFWAFWRLKETGNMRYALWGGLSFAGVILSHNLTAVIITPLVIFVTLILFFTTKEKNKIAFLIPGILGLMLSAFYILPALGELSFVNVNSQIEGTGSKYNDHFLCLQQLWYSAWGFGGSTIGCVDGISFQLGKPFFISVLLGLVSIIFIKNKSRKLLIIISFVILIGAVLMTLSSSKPIWDIFSPLHYLQFPWRFIQIIVFIGAIISGSIIYYIENTKLIYKKYLSVISAIGLILLFIVVYGKLFQPQFYIENYRDESNRDVIKYTVSKISDEYLPKDLQRPRNENEVPLSLVDVKKGDSRVSIQKDTAKEKKVEINTLSKSLIKINLASFPSWRFYIDGKLITPEISNGLYFINIPQGKHNLKIKFRSTKIQLLGNIISVIGVSALLAGIIYSRKRKAL